uniref:Prefoldin subunit 2 n=1 Tax=Magallana gigas TaxID=29159 RepID=A0A8W8KQ17_MAGGI
MANSINKSKEQIVAGFQELRQQQRALASKISELEMDMKEHELVIETLKDVAPERKCFRMVGGVLVERTVKDVLPALVNNKEQVKMFFHLVLIFVFLDILFLGCLILCFLFQMNKLVETLTKQLETKGNEINKYRERHNLKIKGEESKDMEKSSKDVKTGGVLVAKES